MKRKQYNPPCLKVVAFEAGDNICLVIGSDTTEDPTMLSKKKTNPEPWDGEWEEDDDWDE